MSGWVKLYRKIWDWPYSSKPDYVAVWVYLLTHAAHQEYDTIFNGSRITISKGQLVAGRKTISEKTGVSESKIQRILKCFENEQQIEQQTCSSGRLIYLPHWGSYQESEQQIEQQVNNKRTTSEQQVNTIQELKKDKNTKKEKKSYPYDEVVALYHEHCPSLKKVLKLDDQRKKAIRYRFDKGCTLEDFVLAFKGAENNPHNRGENDRRWQANLDYVLRDGKKGDVFLQCQENAPIVTPPEPEPAVEYFEPIGWQKFANEYAEVIRNQIFNKGEGKWENLTPAQQQDLTEKCKEL